MPKYVTYLFQPGGNITERNETVSTHKPGLIEQFNRQLT